LTNSHHSAKKSLIKLRNKTHYNTSFLSFLRGMAEHRRSQWVVQKLRRERVIYKVHSSEARQMNVYIRQDEALLDRRITKLRRTYADIMQAARERHTTFVTHTGKEEQDFGSDHA
jgi:hypothetical protein